MSIEDQRRERLKKVEAPYFGASLFDTVVWRQFSELHTDLWLYFEQTTERVIRRAIHTDTADAETAVEPASLR